jgi:hypothetical protein
VNQTGASNQTNSAGVRTSAAASRLKNPASLRPLPGLGRFIWRGQVFGFRPHRFSRPSSLADRLGIFLSALCIVHCILTPVVLIFLPTVQLFFFKEDFHIYLAIIIPVLAVLAFIPGYLRHRQATMFIFAGFGLSLIIGAAFNADRLGVIGETVVSIIGSSSLIRAHLLNRRLCVCCMKEKSSEQHLQTIHL